MAVAVQHDFTRKLRITELRRFLQKKLAEKIGLAAQSLGNFVAREKVHQFVAEHGNASRLKTDDRYAIVDVLLHIGKYPAQLLLRLIQHAEIIKWPPAANMAYRYAHVKAGGFQHGNGSLGGFRVKVIVKRVRPKDDRRLILIDRCTLFEPM